MKQNSPYAMNCRGVLAAAAGRVPPGGSAGSCEGSRAGLTPIMESRVTSRTSCSSLQPSVPAGRMGITRYLRAWSGAHVHGTRAVGGGFFSCKVGAHACMGTTRPYLHMHTCSARAWHMWLMACMHCWRHAL